MALTNYTTLQASIADWLGDASLTSVIPDFIQLAEAEFNRELRVRDQLTSVTVTLTNGVVALPADFLSVKTLIYPSNPVYKLNYVPNGLEDQTNPYGTAGRPRVFTVKGNTLSVSPKFTGDLSLSYFAKIPPLANNVTNWLLSKHPGAYLYGALYEAGKYKRSSEVISVAGTNLQDEMSKIETSDMPTERMSARLSRRLP